jgi:hypothetical protein
MAGSPLADSMSARALSDVAVDVEQFKAGKSIGTLKFTASGDGKWLTVDMTRVLPGGQTATGHGSMRRSGAVPASGNKVTGTWKGERPPIAPGSTTLFTIKSTDGGLQMSDSTGVGYTAKFDGKAYAYQGDPKITHVSLKRIDDRTFEETDLREGKVIQVVRYTLGKGGKTLHVFDRDVRRHSKGSWTADRQ